MIKATKITLNTAAALLLLVSAPLTLTLGSVPAMAYDDDVEVVCWDHDDGETECESVDDLAAECELSDPEYTTDQCGGLLESRPQVLISKLSKSRR